MPYVDGFVMPIPQKRVPDYVRLARKACKVWMSHGALEYRECIGDDLDSKCGIPFPKQLALKPGEAVVFAWIVYKSRAHRDKVNKAVMADPRMEKMIAEMSPLPFDMNRIVSGGFKVLVEA